MNDATRLERMSAQNFTIEATMTDGKTMAVVARHKMSGREWHRTATEATWPEVRLELLKAIEKDLSTPVDAVPTQ